MSFIVFLALFLSPSVRACVLVELWVAFTVSLSLYRQSLSLYMSVDDIITFCLLSVSLSLSVSSLSLSLSYFNI